MEITTSACIDWLEWTYHEGCDRSIWLSDAVRYWDAGVPRNGYTRALTDPDTGLTMMWHHDEVVHERMGYHFVATGDVMTRLRDHMSERIMLASIDMEGGDDLRITRLDLALDVYNSEMRPADIKACAECGLIEPRSRVRYWTVRTYPSGHQAQSYQIGDKKTKHLIVYDKGMEMGDFDLDMFRLEIRYRQKHAGSAFTKLLAGQNVHEVTKSVIKHELRPQDCALDFILDAQAERVSQEVRDKDFDSLYYWLDNTAMSALKRADAMRPGTATELLRKHSIAWCDEVQS